MGTQKGLIFGSFPCDSWLHLQELKGWPDVVIAADGGVICAQNAGFSPDVYIGDGDSGGSYTSDMISVVLPSEKDLTDLQAAYEWARDHGVTRLIFTACTGGRQDHHLSALQLLETAAGQGIDARIIDPDNCIMFLSSGELSVDRGGYRYFSLIPVDRVLHGVSITGAKYPIYDKIVYRGDSLTVSNEWASEQISVSVSDGACYIILRN